MALDKWSLYVSVVGLIVPWIQEIGTFYCYWKVCILTTTLHCWFCKIAVVLDSKHPLNAGKGKHFTSQDFQMDPQYNTLVNRKKRWKLLGQSAKPPSLRLSRWGSEAIGIFQHRLPISRGSYETFIFSNILIEDTILYLIIVIVFCQWFKVCLSIYMYISCRNRIWNS
jgi:hypothetical protein